MQSDYYNFTNWDIDIHELSQIYSTLGLKFSNYKMKEVLSNKYTVDEAKFL